MNCTLYVELYESECVVSYDTMMYGRLYTMLVKLNKIDLENKTNVEILSSINMTGILKSVHEDIKNALLDAEKSR